MLLTVAENLLAQLSKCIAEHTGMHFPRDRWGDLERGICQAAQEFGFKEPESCIRWLLSSPFSRNQVEVLAGHLTVGETYFFRDQALFKHLEEQVFPQLFAEQSNSCTLRIWCAGCSTGEEPYSLAILLDKILPSPKQWNVTILATDINRHVLETAANGIYSDWSFRAVAPWFKPQYFKKTAEGRWKLKSSIRKMVRFSNLNLVNDHYPSQLNNTDAMHLILCRNVLMYFAPRQVEKVIEQFNYSLVDGGWLIVSPIETSPERFSAFETVSFPDAHFYRKRSMPPLFSPSKPESENSFWQLPPETKSCAEPPKVTKRSAQSTPYSEALALYEAGRYSEAAAVSCAWPTVFQADPEAAALMARIFANQGRLPEAADWCQKAIAADLFHAGYRYLLATIMQERGLLEEARDALRQTLYIDPNFVLGHFTMAILAQQQGKHKESRRYFKNSLNLLNRYQQDETLPESEGMTAGRLAEIIRATDTEVWPDECDENTVN